MQAASARLDIACQMLVSVALQLGVFFQWWQFVATGHREGQSPENGLRRFAAAANFVNRIDRAPFLQSFDQLDPRTIVNAVVGRTDPRSSTIESLSPVIKHFRDLVDFPARFTGNTSAEK